MKPAFTTLVLSPDRKKVTVDGPIELTAKDISAYFWVRVSHPGPHRARPRTFRSRSGT
jgi:hypothetical protein